MGAAKYELWEPDYDTAAQAEFANKLMQLALKFQGEAFALAEKYVRDRDAELVEKETKE